MKISIFVLASTAKLIAAAPRAVNSNTVTLDYGTYQGVTAFGVSNYLGISYAAPPIGDLRWKAPQDPLPTSGIQPATAVCRSWSATLSHMIQH